MRDTHGITSLGRRRRSKRGRERRERKEISRRSDRRFRSGDLFGEGVEIHTISLSSRFEFRAAKLLFVVIIPNVLV